jgi:pyrrolysine biosynthesis protein PylD
MVDLARFEAQLLRVTGLTLAQIAQKAAVPFAGPTLTGEATVDLSGVRTAAVPISAGLGFIAGFAECVTAVLERLGCDAYVTPEPDVRGIQHAADHEARLVFLADDYRFVCLDLRSGVCIDDDPATAHGFAAALAAAAGGLTGEPVLVLGMGPVGRHAARRLHELGANVFAAEKDAGRAAEAAATGVPFELVDLADGLARCHLVFDATPAAAFIDADWVGDQSVAAVPGMPSAFTPAAQRVLGDRHIHDPLALGVAVMATSALVVAAASEG